MQQVKLLPVVLCLALGACAAPTAPSVTAVAVQNVSDQKFARDDAECRARAQNVTEPLAANGELGLQRRYDSVYAECMTGRGYHIEAPIGPRYYYGPGYYGPGAYTTGPAPYWGYGPYWGRGVYYNWGYGPRW